MVATWGKTLAAVPDHCLVRVLAKVNLAISQGISLFFFIACLSQKFIFSLSIGLQVNLLDSQIDLSRRMPNWRSFWTHQIPTKKCDPEKSAIKIESLEKGTVPPVVSILHANPLDRVKQITKFLFAHLVQYGASINHKNRVSTKSEACSEPNERWRQQKMD